MIYYKEQSRIESLQNLYIFFQRYDYLQTTETKRTKRNSFIKIIIAVFLNIQLL